jgi:ABC-type nitrate/sulfonate/bicarbonate transport system substrate-binding protein
MVLMVALAGALSCARSEDKLIAVDVSLGDVSINKVPFLVAADDGLYAKNGLDVHQFITAGAAEDARNSGVSVPADFVRENAGTVPIAIGGGAPMIYGHVTRGSLHRVVIATHERVLKSHIIGPASIGSVDALKEKRIGYSGKGAVTHYGVLAWARKMGWDPERDITLVEGGSSLDAVTEGKVDAAMASVLLVALAPGRGLHDIVDLTQYDIPLAGSGIMAERAWLAANRDTAVRFVKAAVDAVALMKRDRAAVNASVAKWFNITDPATQEGMYKVVSAFPDKPYPSVEGIEAMLALYNTPEMQKRHADEFYDSTIVEELDHSGYLDADR